MLTRFRRWVWGWWPLCWRSTAYRFVEENVVLLLELERCRAKAAAWDGAVAVMVEKQEKVKRGEVVVFPGVNWDGVGAAGAAGLDSPPSADGNDGACAPCTDRNVCVPGNDGLATGKGMDDV